MSTDNHMTWLLKKWDKIKHNFTCENRIMGEHSHIPAMYLIENWDGWTPACTPCAMSAKGRGCVIYPTPTEPDGGTLGINLSSDIGVGEG